MDGIGTAGGGKFGQNGEIGGTVGVGVGGVRVQGATAQNGRAGALGGGTVVRGNGELALLGSEEGGGGDGGDQ